MWKYWVGSNPNPINNPNLGQGLNTIIAGPVCL